jgi:hypothetical protein
MLLNRFELAAYFGYADFRTYARVLAHPCAADTSSTGSGVAAADFSDCATKTCSFGPLPLPFPSCAALVHFGLDCLVPNHRRVHASSV